MQVSHLSAYLPIFKRINMLNIHIKRYTKVGVTFFMVQLSSAAYLINISKSLYLYLFLCVYSNLCMMHCPLYLS